VTDSTRDFFDTLGKVLCRCWIFGFLLLMFCFGFYMLAGGFAQQLHGNMFGLSKHELDVIFYCGMGLFKLFVIVFFFFPWLAIRLVLRTSAE
tara:strand:+ start:158 stop:433 length:276 start_codon:yes stop_codon:yes gene_type:complete